MLAAKNIAIEPATEAKPIDTSSWPLLLKDYGKLHVRTGHFTPLPYGQSPLERSVVELLASGVILLDKPSNPSSHEVVSWVKRILECEKTGHSGTLDPKVTGCLLVCLNRATRLVKAQQNAGKEYVAIIKLHQPTDSSGSPVSAEGVAKALEELTGSLYQRPPLICAVKRQLRIRRVKAAKLLDFDAARGMACFWVSCEAGTYVRTLCIHIGLLLGCGGHMQELRRVKTGDLAESCENLVTLHELMDAWFIFKNEKGEQSIRSCVKPCEALLMNLPRIVVKDSAVNALTYGAKLMVPGVLRFEDGIALGCDVVLMTVKGEAIALGTAQMTTSTIASVDHGVAATIKRNLMPRDAYNTRWGFGPRASEKKQLIVKGLLDKHGKPNENTPKTWLNSEGYLPPMLGSPPSVVKIDAPANVKQEVKEEKQPAEPIADPKPARDKKAKSTIPKGVTAEDKPKKKRRTD